MCYGNWEILISTQVVAGTVAALVQTTLLYPFEFFKSVFQLQRNVKDCPKYIQGGSHQFKTYFAGCLSVNVGILLKTGTRFYVFDKVNEMLEGENILGSRVVVAGGITGFMESLCIVPFENVKMLMMENALIQSYRREHPNEKLALTEIKSKHAHKKTFHKKANLSQNEISFLQYEKSPSNGLFGGIRELYSTKGIRGFYQGCGLTIFRQVGNSVTLFTSFTILSQLLSNQNTGRMDSYTTVAVSLLSASSVVAITQPIDVMKTRMQSKYAWKYYTNSLNCAYRLAVEEGIGKFWKGWAPRLMKIGLSSTVSISMYTYVSNVLNTMRHDGVLK
ncbi:hypothetical protein TBLA_0E00280 [Henningerozyma blattae CBS 6284]|uniref:Mitochondrial carrier protein n=1 Tax=Henningerozyma blattae (strain ATCC 34711 / CBS 6284 / DSM 70876 / NBRC 10599 / NRRL Y-10934 / UCD 77-7) TaxID=1071380 RepID=I2H3Y8_HENB6|nr:hypothetical protein TBLA_0E00280 [Tetrapisispora blattae CBS 6284]CCH61090.1 hypothetical protein TBLA_0E00280 [Tetrapisispora blattae CBS 6284]